jgi:hypothetical protein
MGLCGIAGTLPERTRYSVGEVLRSAQLIEIDLTRLRPRLSRKSSRPARSFNGTGSNFRAWLPVLRANIADAAWPVKGID